VSLDYLVFFDQKQKGKWETPFYRKPLKKAESHWRKQKAIEESGKPLKKEESLWRKQKAIEERGKLLKKVESRWRKQKAVEESWKAVKENRISRRENLDISQEIL
jgi:hypothetical protein